MDTYRTVLYLHLVSLAIGIGAGTVLLVCLFHLRAALTLADTLPWATVAGKTEKAFPVAVVGLFLTGAYMTHDVWTWDTGWIAISLVGLILVRAPRPARRRPRLPSSSSRRCTRTAPAHSATTHAA